jgi:DNA invertase Pin-like site-specific DNA recombinase
MRIGYARVSTEEQNLSLQLDALKASGCKRIYRDKGVSAVARERPAFKTALSVLKSGDILVIWKLDRAFRSTVEAILTLERLRKQGVEFQCVTMHIDTSTPEGRKWYRDTASWAEYERELISQRTKAGMAAARRRGVRIGRPPKLTAAQIDRAHAAIEAGRATKADLAARYGVSVRTLSRALDGATGKKGKPL